MTVHAARQIWRRVQRDVATEEPWRMDAARLSMQATVFTHLVIHNKIREL